jgi:hypothetical protein
MAPRLLLFTVLAVERTHPQLPATRCRMPAGVAIHDASTAVASAEKTSSSSCLFTGMTLAVHSWTMMVGKSTRVYLLLLAAHFLLPRDWAAVLPRPRCQQHPRVLVPVGHIDKGKLAEERKALSPRKPVSVAIV